MKPYNQASFRTSFRGALFLLLITCIPLVGLPEPLQVQASAATVNCPSGHFCGYLPGIYGPSISADDLAITSVEVTQAVQDAENSVPLVAGRSTMLRIYTSASGVTQPVSNVTVSVKAAAAGSNLEVSESPQLYSTTVPLQSSRGDYSSSVNVKLPTTWTSGAIDITVKLDPNNLVLESNKSNNVIVKHLVFTPVPTLRIMIVPIQYHAPNGHVYPAPTKDTISDWITRTYPVSQVQIAWHAPLTTASDLSTQAGFNQLLSDVTSLRTGENAPKSLVYYGLIPTTDGSSSWFSGGIAGVGWVGLRSSIGLDLSGKSSQIAAHEIGHNLGMQHTPCGNPATPDPKYPYPDGSIGQYGLDVTTGQLYGPQTRDVMSYCDPKWISDYTYKVLFTDQSQATANITLSQADQNPAASLPRRGLLIRAQVRPDGANLLPVYVLPAQVRENPEAGAYQVQVFGSQGEPLVQLPVRAFEVGDSDELPAAGINAVIPLPDQPAATVRLLKDGKVLAEQSIRSLGLAQPAGVTVGQAAGGYTVRWAAGLTPVMVRYSKDNGATWSTLSVDASGGELDVPAEVLAAPGGTFDIIQSGVWK